MQLSLLHEWPYGDLRESIYEIDEGLFSNKWAKAGLAGLLGMGIGTGGTYLNRSTTQKGVQPNAVFIEPHKMPGSERPGFNSNMPSMIGVPPEADSPEMDSELKAHDDPALFASLHGWNDLAAAAKATKWAKRSLDVGRADANSLVTAINNELAVIEKRLEGADDSLKQYLTYRVRILRVMFTKAKEIMAQEDEQELLDTSTPT